MRTFRESSIQHFDNMERRLRNACRWSLWALKPGLIGHELKLEPTRPYKLPFTADDVAESLRKQDEMVRVWTKDMPTFPTTENKS
jgi:hypothetical protein